MKQLNEKNEQEKNLLMKKKTKLKRLINARDKISMY